MSETEIKLDILFGSIEIQTAEPRVEGNRLWPRARHITRDRNGNITKDVTHETGVCIIDAGEYASWFYPRHSEVNGHE